MMIHFYSVFKPSDPDTKERQRVAQITWSTQIWTELPIHDSDLPRIWSEEGRAFPYILDVFDFASKRACDSDILVYTNSDICVCSDCSFRIASALQHADACFAYRRDFNHDFNEPIPNDVIPRGDDYCGSDLYAFRAKWWFANRKDAPDMLIGHEAWDPVLRHLMDQTNLGKEIILRDIIYHRRHVSRWESKDNRYRLQGQLHNLNLAAKWLRDHGINPQIHGINQ